MLGQEREQCHISETLKYKRFTINGAGIMATSHKRQASSAKLIEMINTSVKPQAASFKLQAASDKLLDLLTLIKFHGTRTACLDHDKTILRM